MKNWGKGIPEYTRYDVLELREQHELCMAAAVQHLVQEGAEIKAICNKPLRYIQTEVNGEKVFYMVVCSAGQELGHYSFAATREFTLVTKGHDAKAKVVYVGLCSMDDERCAEGLVLRGDELEARVLEIRDLTKDTEPRTGDESYISYWVEQIANAYRDGSFHRFLDILAEDYQMTSMWVLETMKGRERAVDYFTGKSAAIRKAGSRCRTAVVQCGDGTLGVIIRQKRDHGYEDVYVAPTFNDMGQLVKIDICDPGFFRYRRYFDC